MGTLTSKLLDPFSKKKQFRVIMAGLDSVGKTTILYRFKLGEVIQTFPTAGYIVESFEYKDSTLQVWELCGDTRIREQWHYYYYNTQGLIFVVDSVDKERIEEACRILHKALGDENLKNVPLLVYANKQDRAGMNVQEIRESLKLDSIRDRDWYIVGTSAITGEGLDDGLDWLLKCMLKKKMI